MLGNRFSLMSRLSANYFCHEIRYDKIRLVLLTYFQRLKMYETYDNLINIKNNFLQNKFINIYLYNTCI